MKCNQSTPTIWNFHGTGVATNLLSNRTTYSKKILVHFACFCDIMDKDVDQIGHWYAGIWTCTAEIDMPTRYKFHHTLFTLADHASVINLTISSTVRGSLFILHGIIWYADTYRKSYVKWLCVVVSKVRNEGILTNGYNRHQRQQLQQQ